jgi:hypothetical protein
MRIEIVLERFELKHYNSSIEDAFRFGLRIKVNEQ